MVIDGCLWLFVVVYGCLWLFMVVHINLVPIIIIPFGFILPDANRAGCGRAGPVVRSADVAG